MTDHPRNPSSTAERTPRRWQSREVRREEIISAAVKLWADQGYHATSVNDVCKASGLGKGSLYHHIDSKEEILFEIHNRFVDPMLEFGRELASRDVSAKEALTVLSRELMTTIGEYRDHCAIFFREMDALSPDHLELVRAKRKEFQQIVADLIKRGVDGEEFASVDVDLATLAFLGMHNYAYTWLRPGGQASPPEIAALFSQIFLDGLRRRH